jgi:hypothetical protein
VLMWASCTFAECGGREGTQNTRTVSSNSRLGRQSRENPKTLLGHRQPASGLLLAGKVRADPASNCRKGTNNVCGNRDLWRIQINNFAISPMFEKIF